MRRLSALIVLLIVASVAVAAYALRVDQVKVEGLHTLDAADVIRASGIEPGQRILWIRLSAATRAVEKIPAVSRAVAIRMLPGTVVLKVTERKPLAKLDTAPEIVTDEGGRIFTDARAKGLPALVGWHATKSRKHLDNATVAALRAYAGFPRALTDPTRRIVVRPSLTLVLKGGVQVRFGRLTELRTKALAALAVLRAEHKKPVLYVDVRVPSTPVVGDVPTPTPRPPPGPTRGPATPAPAASTAPAATPIVTAVPASTAAH